MHLCKFTFLLHIKLGPETVSSFCSSNHTISCYILVCFHIRFVHLPQVEVELFEHLYKDNSNGDSGEPTGHAQEVHQTHVAPLPEEDGWGQQDQCGEHNVVDGPKHRGVEALKGLVDVPELDDDTAAKHGQEHQTQAEGPLTRRVVVEDVLGSQPNALGGRHGEAPQQGADADVDHDVGGPVGRCNPEDEQQQHEQHDAQIAHKHWEREGTQWRGAAEQPHHTLRHLPLPLPPDSHCSRCAPPDPLSSIHRNVFPSLFSPLKNS